MTALRLVLLVAAVTALAGCGGGTSASEYREQAEEVCTTATREAADVAPPSDTAASVAEYGDAVAAIRQRETVALDELEPPDELESAHRQLVNASGAIVRSLNDLARAAEREDRDAATAAAAMGDRAADLARRAAEELELPACGQPGGQVPS
jgi:hypothetical protein